MPANVSRRLSPRAVSVHVQRRPYSCSPLWTESGLSQEGGALLVASTTAKKTIRRETGSGGGYVKDNYLINTMGCVSICPIELFNMGMKRA